MTGSPNSLQRSHPSPPSCFLVIPNTDIKDIVVSEIKSSLDSYLDHLEQLFHFEFLKFDEGVLDELAVVTLRGREDHMEVLQRDLYGSRLQLAPRHINL